MALCTLLVFFSFVTISEMNPITVSTTHKSSCGNWVPYGNEKCIRIVDSAVFQTKHEAEVVCQSLAEVMELDDIPRVVSVRTEREQKALQQFLFETIGILEPVWLGLDREDDGIFRWNNGADIDYDNLAKQNISDDYRPCVQMDSGQGVYPIGQWVRVNCRKRNVVVCEKVQVWPVAKLQTKFLDFKSKIEKQHISRKEVTSADKSRGRTLHSSTCGDWIPFKDQKCVKLFDGSGTQTKEDADLVCKSIPEEDDTERTTKIVVIKTEEKQKFIQNLLFGQGCCQTFDNVWLGLEMGQNNLFKWNDGTELFFTNWAAQDTIDNDRQCVQMVSRESVYKVGQWVRTNCKKRNAVLCEKAQTWTVTRLQNILVSLKIHMERNQKEWEDKNMATKREAEEKIKVSKLETERKLNVNKQEAEEKINAVKQEADRRINANKQDTDQKLSANKQDAVNTINAVKQEAERKISSNKADYESKINSLKQDSERKIKEAENKINAVKQEADHKIGNLIKNPVPVGFTYIQLPDQVNPSTIWPQVTWKDVTAIYAGLFFRASGGNAAPFGRIQEENSPRLAYVEWRQSGNSGRYTTNLHSVPANGDWSHFVFSGDLDGKKDMYLRFHLSKGEVRPRNKAVVIWKRVA